jgi:hypothetical protein
MKWDFGGVGCRVGFIDDENLVDQPETDLSAVAIMEMLNEEDWLTLGCGCWMNDSETDESNKYI